jgi:glycosyltransferase involved in cell wall biosynthesis
MSNPLVSIITPSFNKGEYIEETISSVQNQSYPNIEHIIIDGGSSDQTLEILKSHENHLTWISEQDAGQSDAINKGLKISNGDILAYLNADDIYLWDTIDTAVEYFINNPEVGMIYGDGLNSDGCGGNQRYIKSQKYNLKSLIYCKNYISQPSVFLRRSTIDTIGEFDINLNLAMDLDYWIRVGLCNNVRYINKPMSIAKIYPSAKSSSMMVYYVKEYEYILDKIKHNLYASGEIVDWCNDALPYVYTKGSLDYLHNGMPIDFVLYLFKALSTNPIGCTKFSYELVSKYIRTKFLQEKNNEVET